MIFWFIGGGAALAALGAGWLHGYNRLVAQRNTVQEAFATMEVFLQQRHDLIPRLVQAVRACAETEAEPLTRVTYLRQTAVTARTTNAKVQDEAALSSALQQVLVQAEAYPQLLAADAFRELRAQLAATERDIANARRYYNGAARQYNNSCQKFPSCLTARMGHFECAAMFEADSEAAHTAQPLNL